MCEKKQRVFCIPLNLSNKITISDFFKSLQVSIDEQSSTKCFRLGLSEDFDSIIALTDTLNSEAKKLGLIINTQKTKTMKLMTTDGRSVPVDGRDIKTFDKFVYLGSTLCGDRDVRKEVRARIGKGSATFND